MALIDFFKGPEHKAKADLLQSELLELQAKYNDLKTKTDQLKVQDLLAIQDLIHVEELKLTTLQMQVTNVSMELNAARSKLGELQHQILGADDAILLESFALYEPKYQFTNSIDYKNRLDILRAEQKHSTRP